ncbi:hypothetical protein [Parathalassolituus penaei]|uniref:Uncharacterized protein n=1 Tax=Parathalassolituus penaei TaxID=2997323 RepID=A0A9X3ITY3_9GAMM|nr:hypothetical protein [Parathalassolituus penaei]MCY0965633.1 hypothetical protein [Parathalassolituus penaei]
MNIHAEQVTLAERVQQESTRIRRVQDALLDELERFGLQIHGEGIRQPFASVRLQEDPFDHSVALMGQWRNPLGMNQGSIQILENGQVFAEFDVLVVHPQRPAWFIEAVTAWGNDKGIKAELRLIPVPGA